MFKKIVSNLAFSPALVGQLGFYAKRLRKEEVTRRLGLIFIALTIVVQSLIVFQPPESANASSPTDMVTGGITSIQGFLSAYDSNTKNLRDVMNYSGITRSEIASATYGSWKTGEKFSWGFTSRFSYAQGERQHNVTNSSGQTVTTIYSRPLKLWGSTSKIISGWTGYSARMGWFGIMKSCGNLVTDILPTAPPPPPPPVIEKCVFNNELLATDEDCKPCAGNETIWYKDELCIPNIQKNKTATNTSQGFIDATLGKAFAGDQISYTINIENTGVAATRVKIEDDLSDILEYSSLIDNGGGTLDGTTKVISWPDVTLGPKTKQSRTFVIRILGEIPATASGASDPTSYDCVIMNTFGNAINIGIDCPVQKIVESVSSELPTTGPTENILFSGIVLAIATYFYARTRQLKTEVGLIRRDTSIGTI